MPTTAGSRLDQAKNDLVERAISSGGGEYGAYLRQYYRHVAPEDLLGRDPDDVRGAALSQLRLAERRPMGTALVRVINPTIADDGWSSPHTVVEVVIDDMPFLVDSVSAELTRHDLAIHLIVHPQLMVRRDAVGGFIAVGAAGTEQDADVVRESFMHVEVDRQSDPATLDRLRSDLRRVLEDVRAVVEDRAKVCARVDEILAELEATPPSTVAVEEIEEGAALLRWMVEGNFTFLGFREYDLTGDPGEEALCSRPGSGLGILRDAGLAPVSRSFADLPPDVRSKALEPRLLTLTKANSRATVQRPSYLDYVGVKRFDAAGNAVGERRFLGLFAPSVYVVSALTVPVVRRKVATVLSASGFERDSHDWNDLLQILETFPRDELFQIDEGDLGEISEGILHLQDRRRVAVFPRRDDYGRFISCLVFLPRDRFTTQVRLAMQSILMEAYGGNSVEYTTRITESVLARLHFIVRTEPGAAKLDVDVDAVREQLTEATHTWNDDLADSALEMLGEARASELVRLWGDAYPEAYKEDFPARIGVLDLDRLDRLGDDLVTALYRPAGAAPGERRFKLFRRGPALSLSAVMPVLQNMGVEVTDERPYELEPSDGTRAYVYDFGLRRPGGAGGTEVDAEVRRRFEEAFAAVWRGEAENDGFNALVLAADLTWGEVAVLRAYAKYLRQTGSTFSQAYIEATLAAHTGLARLLVQLFGARFDPAFAKDRAEAEATLVSAVEAGLDDVASLDEDRILRAMLRLVQATVRTNAYQSAADGQLKDYLSFKLDPKRVPGLPAPRPAYEIWVCSPRVEGVHLRFGSVARGGLRWSDRREDFRTEVLGLVKAQMVKNTVIVPTGAKGGFVVKRPVADPMNREAVMAEGVECYRTFIRGMLDITDNIVAGEVTPPAQVVRHDSDDPYLVVAADKGTATFSDIANAIANDYGFWLGDAFASGGSAGYDHKGMGITARGAWESVKRHFRDLGVDVQSTDFTVVGVGDMSGDVFGNGMLLSQHIRLVAAFDHRHIFLDPAPDAAQSWAERKRLFELPRSSWDDYDKSLISAGGGVFSRAAKSIPVTAEVAAVLGLPDGTATLTPAELMKAILLAPVDLLWNGGIGTYVKASLESHPQVGDKANDAIRVDGNQLRCTVVGEGGNLGLTQRGRIEYALAGGRIYTDAIDNSAGVDTSDHEVNIKILLNAAVDAGDLTRKQRDAQLAAMTDEVAALVLRDNYEQTLALEISRTQGPGMLHVHAAYIEFLEKQGRLDRTLEALPSDAQIAERRAAGLGLTTPEFAVLLAYTKIWLTDAVLASDAPEDPYLHRQLAAYFPTPLREKYAAEMERHRLRREIIVTGVVNEMVNYAGVTFAFRIGEETGASAADIVRAWATARDVYDVPDVVAAIESLDNQVEASVQTQMQLRARQLVERATRWLLQNRRPPLDVTSTVAALEPGIRTVVESLPKTVTGHDRERFDAETDELVGRGVPAELAARVASLTVAYSALDIVDTATSTGRDVAEVAQLYFALDERLLLWRLREQVLALPRDTRWQTLARAALRDDLYAAHAALVADVIAKTDSGLPVDARLSAWVEANQVAVGRAAQILGDVANAEIQDLATLSVALRQIRGVIQSSAASS
ncbi:MAG: glutamate dehydrogenase [Frankiales bacterium]|nr:glutamate dehydrogenase [Frankiales bacterium]